jgi:hypothetical protein
VATELSDEQSSPQPSGSSSQEGQAKKGKLREKVVTEYPPCAYKMCLGTNGLHFVLNCIAGSIEACNWGCW